MTAHRERPALLPDPGQRLLVVEASAGTGKTFFLEHRVVDLLLRAPGATIDQILVVTFTEKATAELRGRIRALLAELATLPDGPPPPGATPETTWAIDDDARRKLRDALAGFDRAPIHTIHGFCQRLLVEDAFAGRRLFDQQQVPDEGAFLEAFHAVLRERIAVEPELCALLAAYLDAGGAVAGLARTLLECARRGAPVTPELDPARLVGAAERLRDAVAPLPDEVEALTARCAAIKNAQTRKAAAGHTLALATRARGALAAHAGEDVVGRALRLVCALSDGASAKAFEYLGSRRDALTGVGGEPGRLVAAALEVIDAWVPLQAVCAGRFLPLVQERVRATKRRRGQFDFQDMLRLVRDVLHGDRGAELADRLRRRHRWAMIDEFQDTDELQWDIFRTVWADGDDTALTIVGDPKQAIYSFRGADVYTYLGAREELRRRGAPVMHLDACYRSSADLVAAVNALIDGTYGRFFDGDIGYDAPVHAAGPVAAARPDGSAPPPVTVFELVPAPGEKALARHAQATLVQRIADEIHALLDPDEARRLRVRDRRGDERALAPRDVHVLTRSAAQSDEVAAALRARGVPCAVYQREHLFDADEAREIADLLDAIADPRDRSARLRAWTTSFFAVPLAELGALGDVPDGHPLLARLHDWRGLALRKDLDGLFARILDDTRWIERTLVAGGGERAITNVLHVFELLHDDAARSPCELRELADRLRGWIETGTLDRPDDVDLQRLETDRHAVQVMTIHRAKGLEAACVFVCAGTGAHPGRDDEPRLYHGPDRRRRAYVGRPVGDAAAWIARDTIEENQRLMYVAITRAKVRLYLPRFHGVTVAPEAALAPLHACVAAALEARATDADAARLFASERVELDSLAPPAPVDAAEDLDGWTPPPPEEQGDEPGWAEVRGARRGPIVTSYSRLKHAAERASDPAEVRGEDHSPRTAAAVAEGELPGGAATGLFLHDALEHVAFESVDGVDEVAWGALPAVQRALAAAARRHGVDARHLDRAARLLHRAIARPIELGTETLPPLARARRAAREVEFVYPLQTGGREAFARGFIDLLVAWDDRLWVVDYKSDVVPDPSPDAVRAYFDEHYQVQARLYAVAAARLLGLGDDGDCRRRFGGILYWFLRRNHVVRVAAGRAELDAWEAELARQVVDAEPGGEGAR